MVSSHSKEWAQAKNRNFNYRARERKMILGGDFTRVALGLTAFLFLTVVRSQEICSKTCIAQHCKGFTIRYGKYCGFGYVGCPGERPCDDLDSCCMHHDNCVDLKGMTYVKCHKEFQRCVSELSKSVKQSHNQKVGFSTRCPYSTVIPTVSRGMELGIFFSKIGNIIKPPPKGIVEVDLARIRVDTKDGLGTNKGIQTKEEGSKVFASMNPSPFLS